MSIFTAIPIWKRDLSEYERVDRRADAQGLFAEKKVRAFS
jgi:hypothetical protein